jgi:kynurenine formamidase
MKVSSVVVDLTLEFRHGMPVVAPWPPPLVLPFATHESSRHEALGEEDDVFTYAATYVSTLDHAGTHVDAPYHYDPRGATIDRCPLGWFAGKAVCLDVSSVRDREEIDVALLEAAEAEADVRVSEHIVLLHSGFHARHYPRASVLEANPGLTAAATHWLADRGSRAHGVEGPSTDLAGSRTMPSHRVCRDRGLIHYEWLVNLHQLLGRREFEFIGYPLKLVGGTASPVRAVAVIG